MAAYENRSLKAGSFSLKVRPLKIRRSLDQMILSLIRSNSLENVYFFPDHRRSEMRHLINLTVSGIVMGRADPRSCNVSDRFGRSKSVSCVDLCRLNLNIQACRSDSIKFVAIALIDLDNARLSRSANRWLVVIARSES